MSEENNDNKSAPPGWNDPPASSPRSTAGATTYKLTQRVVYPMSSGDSSSNSDSPRSDVAVAAGPVSVPPLKMSTPPMGPSPLQTPRPTPIPSAPPLPEEYAEEDVKLLDELREYVQKLAETHGRDKAAEIDNRFQIMAKMWPILDKLTKTLTYEALKSLYDNDIERAKDFHERLIQECGLNVVHWVLMIKILIKHMSEA